MGALSGAQKFRDEPAGEFIAYDLQPPCLGA